MGHSSGASRVPGIFETDSFDSWQETVIILESERLLFRQHELADLDAFCAMEMDAEVRRYVGGYPRSREDAERKFPHGQLHEVSGRLGVWATVLKSNGQYIGRCGLYPHIDSAGEMVVGEATLSFYIAREHWGLGLASEAATAFVEFGWKQLQLSRIVATVQVGNGASVRILEKLGFELIATEVGQRSFFKFALSSPEQRNR
jgi:[ribosomal protein S5]-alanine N-acetyltransferase